MSNTKGHFHVSRETIPELRPTTDENDCAAKTLGFSFLQNSISNTELGSPGYFES